MLFVIATLAIAGAAVGPIFLASSDNSVLASTLSSAPAGNADVLFLESGPNSVIHEINQAAKTANVASHNLLGKPIFVADLGTGYLQSRVLFIEDLFWRTGHLRPPSHRPRRLRDEERHRVAQREERQGSQRARR